MKFELDIGLEKPYEVHITNKFLLKLIDLIERKVVEAYINGDTFIIRNDDYHITISNDYCTIYTNNVTKNLVLNLSPIENHSFTILLISKFQLDKKGPYKNNISINKALQLISE